ncbi:MULTISPECIES: hypothetical protein [Acinetobacter]|jgi:hypothetical protein|uniref:hypothetical protein n=1 Tax=Acinetobacter TaxID=469 RepID=UPI00083930B7|nr:MULTISPECIES: hypothetical protein [Acinetobacter calcoaceticus/baumannii complex]MBJ8488201.1 hypothetical protein [Acinetobacter pittii]MCY0270513.1 hypothetical protein [Acinetobacter baumannii]OCY55194.1 hypothetical protein BFR66_19330 [Acinetobacter pittii]OTS04194.1 hypothetical protein CAT24_04425 [Acinetobacter pittii]
MQFNQVDNPRGNEKKIAGQKWIFAPAPLGAIERFQDQLSSASVPVAVIIDMAHICLKRNYPDITREFIADELIDIGNMQEILDLVVNVSGLDHKGDKEATDSGE